MGMSREDVFKSSGPTSGANIKVKMGATKDGTFVAGFAELKYQAGAFPGSSVQPGVMCAYAPYDIENVKVIGYDVVSNRPKVAACRAPGAPISEFAVESVVDEIAKKLEIDPVELRLQNAAREGTKAAYGPKFGPIGLTETLHAVEKTNHYTAPPSTSPSPPTARSSSSPRSPGGTCIESLRLAPPPALRQPLADTVFRIPMR